MAGSGKSKRDLRPHILIKALCGVLLFCATLTPVASALDVPSLTQRVNDYAQMISPGMRILLETKLEELEKTDSTQVVILTIETLDGENLKAFSIRVAEAWMVGQEKPKNGLILLVSTADRRLHIEAAHGLEGVMTGSTAESIIKDVITPRFKQGNFDQGLLDGVTAIVETVRGKYSVEDVTPRKISYPSPFVICLLIAAIAAPIITRRIKKVENARWENYSKSSRFNDRIQFWRYFDYGRGGAGIGGGYIGGLDGDGSEGGFGVDSVDGDGKGRGGHAFSRW